jgi:hypothetical protein
MSHDKIREISEVFSQEKLLLQQLLAALYREHEGRSSVAKHIARTTNISVATIHHWMRHAYLPKTADLLKLMTFYPEVLRVILEHVGASELWAAASHENLPQRMHNRQLEKPAPQPLRGDIPAIPHVIPCAKNAAGDTKWNRRQEWFLREVASRCDCQSKDIEGHWGVTLRTAKRDIAGLVATNAIRFLKRGRGGYYVLVTTR